MTLRNRGPRPPAFFLGALLLQIAAHVLLPAWRAVPRPWNLLGVALVVGGTAVSVIADQQFKRSRTPVDPFQPPATLVTTGVFAVSRHPMYVGMIAILLGVAIVLGTATPLVVPLLFGWLLAVRFVRMEEAALVERFGQAYTAYARRVRRWL